MDKNNDIQVNRVSKWEAAPVSIKNLRNYISESWVNYAAPPCCPPLDPSCQDSICESMMILLESVLDDYNELEVKYQESCGMISQYEEENRKLKSELDIRTDECDDLISRVLRQDEEYAKLEDELRIREKEKDEKDKLIDELNSKFKVLKLSTNMMYGCYGYGLNTPNELNRKIEELKKENEELKSKNRSLQLRTNMMYGCHRSTGNANRTLAKVVAGFENKNKELEKENKGLKDTLNKDREFGKYVGKLVADSIQEGCDKGIYELHPYTRVEIHVEETNNMPTTFDRHAIPRIAVTFNNSQTEMERDTARHECEELNEKIDTVWRANDELNRKIKELKKENIDLKTTLAICERDANTAKNLCDGISFQAEHARNKTPWFTNTSFNNEEEK